MKKEGEDSDMPELSDDEMPELSDAYSWNQNDDAFIAQRLEQMVFAHGAEGLNDFAKALWDSIPDDDLEEPYGGQREGEYRKD